MCLGVAATRARALQHGKEALERWDFKTMKWKRTQRFLAGSEFGEVSAQIHYSARKGSAHGYPICISPERTRYPWRSCNCFSCADNRDVSCFAHLDRAATWERGPSSGRRFCLRVLRGLFRCVRPRDGRAAVAQSNRPVNCPASGAGTTRSEGQLESRRWRLQTSWQMPNYSVPFSVPCTVHSTFRVARIEIERVACQESSSAMSALLPKADMCGALAHVRFVPKADILHAPKCP